MTNEKMTNEDTDDEDIDYDTLLLTAIMENDSETVYDILYNEKLSYCDDQDEIMYFEAAAKVDNLEIFEWLYSNLPDYRNKEAREIGESKSITKNKDIISFIERLEAELGYEL